ncbi:DNA polymerase-3 subunit gamma/tau [Natranaerovirga hydrolytica]|uniref:DNA-directed DNA polymerase n=1 Tax=Natranaerovirga hydrolytica TaxID=680378 RepID=A0A4R1N919_9FIRM|nr:DNA polymerase III subunit gamma/tau [Natranaerovirga hydrolytica]TCL00061.1 DNA polymerase-3 subunit gamma/tau [Natranaerovirga hydrolytica]
MSYVALYRKFRPREFKDVVGQEHIVKTLTNQLKFDRVGHAYLFNGTRGTGKTSTAKIFGKAVNCLNPMEGNPCNECEVCQGINEQKYMNIIEIDAASNNGVDNIRDIRDEVVYTPTNGKYKVYIIDEVHMLSIGAFNALLKTLEEPPEHVIFILATTEPQKIPITILSRCQRYDFKRISVETIANRLTRLMEEENIEVEERALRYISKVADGSMRDALSILDQCISFFIGEIITMDMVLDILGAVDTTVFNDLLEAIIKKEVNACLKIIEKIIIQGRDLPQFINDFIWFLRSLLITKTVKDPRDILDMADESILLLKEQGKNIEEETVLRYIRILSDLSNQIKYSSQKRVLTEVALINMCQPEMEEDYTALIQRIKTIEKQLKNGIITKEIPKQTIINKEEPKQEKKEIKKPQALTEDIKQLIDKWAMIVGKLPMHMKPYIKRTKATIDNEQLIIICEDELVKSYLEVEERKETLKEIIESTLNKTIQLNFKELKENEAYSENDDIYAKIEKKVNFEISYED